MDYPELMNTVVNLLRQSFDARHEGGPHVRKVRAQAYVDGYMRALVDAGHVDHQQLLELITQERARDAARDALDAAEAC